MKNTMIPQEDVAKLKEVVEKVDEYIKNHKNLSPTIEGAENRLQRIHTILYLELTKDLISSAKGLEALLNDDEEEFIKSITNDGEMTVEEVERSLMMNVLMEMLTK